MNKQLTILGSTVLIIAALSFTAATTQQEKNNHKKEQQQQGRNKDKAPKEVAKDNPGKHEDKGQPGRKDQQGKQDKNERKDNNGKHEANDHQGKKDNNGHGNHDMKDGYKWDRETFKDRKKYRNQEKVTICHKFRNNDEQAVTIRVSSHALKAHMAHGDIMGDCPVVNNKRYSDIFLRNRTDYYNNIQNHYEQVSYSRSILDYAQERLTYSRQQLAVMQANNIAAAEIERKQATVVQLEQNVSLLETLVGVAANLLVNKFL